MLLIAETAAAEEFMELEGVKCVSVFTGCGSVARADVGKVGRIVMELVEHCRVERL